MQEREPVTVEFPLQGEWTIAATPAHRVPSHGTDMLGQRYAFDILKLNDGFFSFHSRGMLAYLAGQVRLSDSPSWGQPIFAPFNGVVVEARDGLPERQIVHLVRDVGFALYNALFFDAGRSDLHAVAGNYVILQGEEAYAFFAHARNGSLVVSKGEAVRCGQKLAEVGHSGNSGAPHLHFHLMDRADLRTANGIQCRFREYEAFENGDWTVVRNGIPKRMQRVRVSSAQSKTGPTASSTLHATLNMEDGYAWQMSLRDG